LELNLLNQKNEVILEEYKHLSSIFLFLGIAILSFPGQLYSNYAFSGDFSFNMKVILLSLFAVVSSTSLIVLSYRLRTLEFVKTKIRIRN